MGRKLKPGARLGVDPRHCDMGLGVLTARPDVGPGGLQHVL